MVKCNVCGKELPLLVSDDESERGWYFVDPCSVCLQVVLKMQSEKIQAVTPRQPDNERIDG